MSATHTPKTPFPSYPTLIMPGDDFGYETDSDYEVDETLVVVQVVMERRRLAAAAAARRQKSGPRGKKRRSFSFFSWEDHKHRLSDATSSCATD